MALITCYFHVLNQLLTSLVRVKWWCVLPWFHLSSHISRYPYRAFIAWFVPVAYATFPWQVGAQAQVSPCRCASHFGMPFAKVIVPAAPTSLGLCLGSWGLSLSPQHLQLGQTKGLTSTFLSTPPSHWPFVELIQVPRRYRLSFIPCVLFCLLNKLIQRVPELAQGRGRERTAGSRRKKSKLFSHRDKLLNLLLP